MVIATNEGDMNIQNLIKDYGDFKIDIPEWSLPDHGITALSGSSGSGKTSVIRLLLGLDSCPSLSWVINAVDIAKQPVSVRRLGVVFQNYELFRHMTAEENILFAARARKISLVAANEKLQTLSARLRIDHILQRPAEVLSGGERQRVALARALIGEPRFLFLDEPFTALDAGLRSDARSLVKAVVNEFNIPTLLVSHDAADISALAESVTVIREGRLVK